MRSALTIHAELNDFDEQELVARAQNGDTEAFNPLVYKYQQKIYNLIYRKVRDRETAKDLCQEVFLKAWQALPNFKGQSVFYSWLYQIALFFDFTIKNFLETTPDVGHIVHPQTINTTCFLRRDRPSDIFRRLNKSRIYNDPVRLELLDLALNSLRESIIKPKVINSTPA